MASTDPSVTSRGAYSSLNQGQDRIQGEQEHQPLTHGQVFPLQDKTSLTLDPMSDIDHDDFRVTFPDSHEAGTNRYERREDDEDDDDDDDLDNLGDNAPLASSKRYYPRSGSTKNPSLPSSSSWSSHLLHPCKGLAAVLGIAMVVALAFGLLSLPHLTLGQDGTNIVDNRVLKPPPGTSADDFKLSDFQIPSWDWDLNSYVPINITNGPKFARIVWKEGEEKQYLVVDCPHQPSYRYHFPSFTKDEFRDYPTASQGVDDLLPLGEEPFVFVLCPPGINQANIVFREFDRPKDSLLSAPPPHVDGTMEAPQPLLDDVVMILIDAISRAKFTHEMKTVMETLTKINSTAAAGGSPGTNTGYRIFDFEHYNVLGQNSPPNKAFIYSGQSIKNMKEGPKHWLWDVFEEQGFKTAHTDGECGGERGVHDYTSGAISLEYSHSFNRIPAQYQLPQTVWCHNHDMHGMPNLWGQSCTLPAGVKYDSTLMGGMRWNTPYCAGEKAIHEHIMENLEGWLVSTKGQRRFATYSLMDTHSPDHNHISFDRRLATLVQKLLVGQDGQPPLLSPKSALVIMADHGLHYGPETYSFSGFIHHKIPPLFIALPTQFLETRPNFVEALEQNQNRILSHLDLHQTLIHLAYGDMPVE
ncbi:hypothetical protein BGZ65_005857, partial [Modicella reniformis]